MKLSLQRPRQVVRVLLSKPSVYEQLNGPVFQRRVWNTLLLVFAFRVVAGVPLFNVDEERLQQLLAANPMIGIVDLFAGGEVLTHFSLVAAGIFPFLVARAMVYGATWLVPSLRDLRKERSKQELESIIKRVSVPLAFVLAIVVSQYLPHHAGLFAGQAHWFTSGTFLSSLWIISLVTLGSVLSTWISHWISRIGIGTGETIILLVGASVKLAAQLVAIVRHSADGIAIARWLGLAVVGALVLVVLSFNLVEAQRRIPFKIAKKAAATGPSYTENRAWFIPIPLIVGGTLPVSGAVGLLLLLQYSQGFLAAHFEGALGAFGHALGYGPSPAAWWFWVALAGLIILFTYACNFSMLWSVNKDDNLSLADQLRRKGVWIPGKRPGQETEDYLSRVLAEITPAGALGMAFLAVVLPYLIFRLTGQDLIVTVLSVMVIVSSFDTLRAEAKAHWTMSAYSGFTLPRRKRR